MNTEAMRKYILAGLYRMLQARIDQQYTELEEKVRQWEQSPPPERYDVANLLFMCGRESRSNADNVAAVRALKQLLNEGFISPASLTHDSQVVKKHSYVRLTAEGLQKAKQLSEEMNS